MKNILIASLLAASTVGVQAASTDNGASTVSNGKSISQVFSDAQAQSTGMENLVAELIAANPESVLEIIALAIISAPDQVAVIVKTAVAANAALPNAMVDAGQIVDAAIKGNATQAGTTTNTAEIVQAAVEADPTLANEIVASAIANGADADEMLVAAISGGADEATVSADTAAGGSPNNNRPPTAPSIPGFGGGSGGGGGTASPN